MFKEYCQLNGIYEDTFNFIYAFLLVSDPLSR